MVIIENWSDKKSLGSMFHLICEDKDLKHKLEILRNLLCPQRESTGAYLHLTQGEEAEIREFLLNSLKWLKKKVDLWIIMVVLFVVAAPVKSTEKFTKVQWWQILKTAVHMWVEAAESTLLAT